MGNISRLTAETVREGVLAGDTLLVCAYESDEKFGSYKLEGAIPLSAFKKKAEGLDKNTRIVFYCA